MRFTLGVALGLAAIIVVSNLGGTAGSTQQRTPRKLTARDLATLAAAKPPGRPKAAPREKPIPPRHPRVGIVVLHLVDRSRTVSTAAGSAPRSFDTIVRYPIGLRGPFPLIVFGHGYAVTPAPYSRLLDRWTKAGYIVASPIFPLENAGAPGGPNENDLPNQPGDMSLVISRLLHPATSAATKLQGLADLHRIAVSGQSDGGDTALAVAYDPSVRDPRISAAIILSGMEDPFAHRFAMPAHGPPLLAIQGSADTINPPGTTRALFDQASPPKYLLTLVGAGHLPPYTEPGLELTTVEHMTLAFLNHYLKGLSRAFPRYLAARSAGPGSILNAVP
jgi:predicted dienelactone hydrolase